MSGLSPGTVLPKDMDQRQWSTWNRQQAIGTVATTAAAAAVAAHVALPDPHAQYAFDTDLTAAIAALNLSSSTYTPTLTNTLNVTSSTGLSCQYLRVGSVVTVSGEASVTTTGAGATTLGVSLPVASNFANTRDCAGAGIDYTATTLVGVFADVANGRATFSWTASSGALRTVGFQFTYRII